MEGAEPTTDSCDATCPLCWHGVPITAQPWAQCHLRRSQLRRTHPGTRPWKGGGGIRARPVPLEQQSGVRAGNGGAASAPQLTAKEGLARPHRHFWDSGQGLGDTQRAQLRAGHARGGSQGRISAGSGQAAMDGHGCVCAITAACAGKVPIKPLFHYSLAGTTSCALVYRTLLSVWITPRAETGAGTEPHGQAGAAGAAACSRRAMPRQTRSRGSTS